MASTFDASQLKATVQKILNNRENALNAAGLVLLADAQQAIKDSGPGWAPFKSLPKRPHQLLWETGTLIQSLSMNADGNVFKVDGDSVTVGSNVVYAKYQNDGTSRLPARPFLFIDDKRTEDADKAYTNALLKGVS